MAVPTNPLIDLGSYSIVGVMAALLVEAIKKKLGTTTFWSRTAIVAAAVLGGFGIYLVSQQPTWYVPIAGVLGAASTFYGFLLAKNPSTPSTP